jgi:hypothetical protein
MTPTFDADGYPTDATLTLNEPPCVGHSVP